MRTSAMAALGGTVLLILAPAAGAGQAAGDGGPWRLFRQYQNMPGPQEVFTFWVSAPDLAAADGPTPQARMLVLDLDSGGWSIARIEYLCGRGQARGLGRTLYDRDGRVIDRQPDETEPWALPPHVPIGAVYNVVCNDTAPGDLEVADIAAAFTHQAADRRDYLDALAAAEASAYEEDPAQAAADAAGVAADAPCSQSRLLNPFFTVAVPPQLAESGPDAVLRRGRNASSEELYGWRAVSGSTPVWEALPDPDMGLIRLSDRHGLHQGDLDLPGGRWRLTLGAGDGGDGPARLVAHIGGSPVGSAPLEAGIGLHSFDFDLAADAQTLALVAEGAGAMLVMACLDWLGDLPRD